MLKRPTLDSPSPPLTRSPLSRLRARPLPLPLLRHFVRQDLVDRHGATALGAAWTLLLPLANILIFTLVFSRIMGARLDALGMAALGSWGYSVYLVSGLLAWLCFAGTLSRITSVYQEKAGLLSKVQISLVALPLFVVASELAVFGISMGFFVIFLLLIGFEFSLFWLWLVPIIAVQQLLAYGLGLGLATLSVFLRDTREVVNVVVQFWFWLTPIVYVADILPPQAQALLWANPMYHVVGALRDTLLLAQWPDLRALAALGLFALGLVVFSVWFNRRLERDIRDFL